MKNVLSAAPAPQPARFDLKSPNGRMLVAVLLGLCSMSSVQFGSALSAPVMDRFGVFSTTWLRLTWAAVILAIAAQPKFRSYTRKHWVAAGLLGASMALLTLCFFFAITRISLGLLVAVGFLGPLTVGALGVRRKRAMLWPALAVIGVGLLVYDRSGWHGDLVGLLCAAGVALGWGGYIVLMKHSGKVFNGLEGLTVSLIVAALLSMPFGLMEHGFAIEPAQLVSTAWLAVLVPLLPYTLEIIALRNIPASSFGILMSLEPALGVLAGFVVLHQAITAQQLLGVFCVVGASIGVALFAG